MKKLKYFTRIVFFVFVFINSIKCQTNNTDMPISFSTGFFDYFSQSSEGLLSVGCNIHNNSGKTIEYLTLKIEALDKSGDILIPNIGSVVCTITESIPPYESYSTSLNCGTYYNDEVDKVKLYATFVKYQDGTTKEYPSEHFIHDKALGFDNPVIILSTLLGAIGAIIIILLL